MLERRLPPDVFEQNIPHALSVCFALTVVATTAAAQVPSRSRSVANETPSTTANDVRGRTRLENDLVVAPAQDADGEPG